MRTFTILPCSLDMLPDAWRNVIGNRQLFVAILCEFGWEEEVIGYIEFSDGTFEVGVGESGKDYILLYKGESREVASSKFVDQIHFSAGRK